MLLLIISDCHLLVKFKLSLCVLRRFISNSTFFVELVQLARKAPSARSFIGGNAPIMAKRFSKEGWTKILLGAQGSKSLQAQFPSGFQVSGPIVEEDDVHLLLEYPSGQKWGSFVPPRANRLVKQFICYISL